MSNAADIQPTPGPSMFKTWQERPGRWSVYLADPKRPYDINAALWDTPVGTLEAATGLAAALDMLAQIQRGGGEDGMDRRMLLLDADGRLIPDAYPGERLTYIVAKALGAASKVQVAA
ncbi:hypothetical protein [Zavarzinia sp.]|uniref:hypothetical protein n=1 Tax=Zavarzinia sp. TaxID=2027920 RepID=UPI003BB65D96